jgi:C1A family cysteine protease
VTNLRDLLNRVNRTTVIKDVPDNRDYLYVDTHAPVTNTVTTSTSLREKFGPILSQGSLSSCTAHAALDCYQFEAGGGPYSRLAAWYYAREMEGTTNKNIGVQVRNAVKVLNTHGVGLEADWQYITSKFRIAPTGKEEVDAPEHKIISYSRLLNGTDYRRCLSDGYPFLIGVKVYHQIHSVGRDGLIIMPTGSVAGWHCLTVIGFRTINHVDYYEVRNSWGMSWGNAGYGFIPSIYLENPDLAQDAWTIRK